MNKLKVITVLGTRPEIIRLSQVLKEMDSCMDHVLVHTGQNYDYELNEVFFNDLGLRKPDYFLNVASLTAASTVANVIEKVDSVLEKEKPDALLVLGDTNSCMAAYSAKRRKVPVFHMEAGNRCFDGRVPEEINRKIIDHMSDMNLVYSDLSRQNLINEGLPLDRIIKTGSPLYEVINKHKKKIASSDILDKLNIKEKDYFVLSAHREENIDIEDNFDRLIDVIKIIVSTYNKPVIFSIHPRTRKKIEEKNISLPKEVILLRPMGLFDYLKLQQKSLCVISDSGTISEEASILNFSAINIRETHERHEAMDEAVVIMSGLNPGRVIQSIELACNHSGHDEPDFFLPASYSKSNVSKKVPKLIISYVDYVKRFI